MHVDDARARFSFLLFCAATPLGFARSKFELLSRGGKEARKSEGTDFAYLEQRQPRVHLTVYKIQREVSLLPGDQPVIACIIRESRQEWLLTGYGFFYSFWLGD